MDLMLFSEDLYFTEVFSTYVIHNYPEFHISFFSNESKALQFLKEHQNLDAVIAASSFWKQFKEESGSFVEIEIGSKTILPGRGERALLNIYQPGVDIAGDIRKILVALSDSKIIFYNDRNERIVTFYSTQGGSGTTSIAYMTAIQLAKTGQTAYLNFEENPFTDHLYKQKYDVGMENILFAVKDKRDLASILVSGFKKNEDHVYTLPTMRSLHDFKDIMPEDVELLLQSLLELGDIQYLVMDLSAGVSDLNRKIIEMSDAIFMVYGADQVGKGKKERFITDPGIDHTAYRGRIKYILNKCLQREDGGGDSVQFPYSQSVAQGIRLSSVLINNGEFTKGCSAIVDMIIR